MGDNRNPHRSYYYGFGYLDFFNTSLKFLGDGSVEDAVDDGLTVGVGTHVSVGEGVETGTPDDLPLAARENLLVS